jgi:hypothetical protein
MKLGNDELLAHARRLGLLSSNCDTCAASGMRGPRVDPRDPHAAALDAPCADCEGSGRWWFPATRPFGVFTAHLTDAQVRSQITTAGDNGALRGN